MNEELKKIRDYFGEHDKTTFEHWAYTFLNTLINSQPAQSGEELEAEFKLLYRKINTLAIEIDGSIVSNIKETVNKIYNIINKVK